MTTSNSNLTLNGNSGSNTLTGGAGNDQINGRGGDDVLSGGAGNDEINGGAGNDILDGGSGSDELEGGSGNDRLIYKLSENNVRGTHDEYDGGSGTDTLELQFTRAEWMNATNQTVLQSYLNWASKSGSNCHWDDEFTFKFGNAKLEIENIEKLVVKVDGVEIKNAGHNTVDAVNDNPKSITEDEPGVQKIDVLFNDSVDDLVKELKLDTGPAHGTVVLIKPTLPNGNVDENANNWYFNYTSITNSYQKLNVGDTATESFTYTVTDANGDHDTATVNITITGLNDKPVVEEIVHGQISYAGSANVTELINLDYSNPIIAAKAALGGDYDYKHVRTGQFFVSDKDASDNITLQSTATGGSDYLGEFTASISDQKNANGKYLVTWKYEANDSILNPLNKNTDGTASKDQTYTLTFKSGVDTVSTDVNLHLFGRDEIKFIDGENAGNNIFIGENVYHQKFNNPGNDVIYLGDEFGQADANDKSDVIYGENGGGYFTFVENDSVIFGGDGVDYAYFYTGSDNGLFFGGNDNDVISFYANNSSKKGYSWGGNGADEFRQYTNTTAQIDSWVMDFDSIGGDKIGYAEFNSRSFKNHQWINDADHTRLIAHQANDSHPFLSDGAMYYELQVKSNDVRDTNWYSVFNLVGTDLTVQGLFNNGNLVAF